MSAAEFQTDRRVGAPADTRVEQRVPKKLLLEQGAPTSADKRRIQDGIEEVSGSQP